MVTNKRDSVDSEEERHLATPFQGESLYTLPETNSLPLKMDGWKTIRLPFGDDLSSGAMLNLGSVT